MRGHDDNNAAAAVFCLFDDTQFFSLSKHFVIVLLLFDVGQLHDFGLHLFITFR